MRDKWSGGSGRVYEGVVGVVGRVGVSLWTPVIKVHKITARPNIVSNVERQKKVKEGKGR